MVFIMIKMERHHIIPAASSDTSNAEMFISHMVFKFADAVKHLSAYCKELGEKKWKEPERN